MDHSSEKRIPLPLSYLTDRSSIMSASQNKKKTLSLGLALIPVISMLLLLIIGYGIMGQELSRRREPIYYGWIVKNWDWMTNS